MDNIKHLVRIGELQEDIGIYLEDYVYTYLKKVEEEDAIHKLYLFGEKTFTDGIERLYVYGMSELRQDAKTFFGEYELLGTLQLQEKERYFSPLPAVSISSDQEIHMEGFFVFYANNKAMQEFLIARHKNKKQEDKPAGRDNKKFSRTKFNYLPVPDKDAYTLEDKKRQKETFGGSLMLVCSVGVACLLAAWIYSGWNPDLLRQMIPGIVSEREEESNKDSLIVEEIGYAGSEEISGEEETQEAIAAIEPQAVEATGEASIAPEAVSEEAALEEITSEETESEETASEELPSEEAATEETTSEGAATEETVSEETTSESTSEETATENTYFEYTVQEGDTLANICLAQYGSLEKMAEICEYNEISNADHIAPGEKIYLPD